MSIDSNQATSGPFGNPYYAPYSTVQAVNQLAAFAAIGPNVQTANAVATWNTGQTGPTSDHNLLNNNSALLSGGVFSNVNNIQLVPSGNTGSATGLYDVSGALYYNNMHVGGSTGSVVSNSSSVTAADIAVYATTGNNNTISNVNTQIMSSGDINFPTVTNSIRAQGGMLIYCDAISPYNCTLGYQLYGLTGTANTFLGSETGILTTGSYNTFVGANVGFRNTTGIGNTLVGYSNSSSLTTGNYNTLVGGGVCTSLITGGQNACVGYQSLANTLGSGNCALGYQAGNAGTTGSGNIWIGNVGLGADNSVIKIGSAQTSNFQAGIYGVTAASSIPVYINAQGQLGTVVSSQQYKKGIEPLAGSEIIYKLQPKQFKYIETDEEAIGLIAEEVERLYPKMCAYKADGSLLTVKYDMLAILLLDQVKILKNEILDLKVLIKHQAILTAL